MRLWGNIDDPTGNNKPKYANTSNMSSNSSINSTQASNVSRYGFVYGVTRGEIANTAEKGVKHPGWVSQKLIPGGILRLDVMNASNLINVVTGSGSLIFTDNASATGDLATQSNAAATFTVTANVLSVTLTKRGSYMLAPTVSIANSNASIRVTMSDRAGKRKYETLVAMKGLTSNDVKDDFWFPGA